jgi:ketosteroid isomerase-like protein
MVDAENRNNMAGVIGAFRRVFAARCDVTLTIKTNSLSDADIATSARLCARDGRIEISSNSTHEADVDEIFHAADVFLSLLRCDWYEQNITRAMSYTIPVITNNCAGHLELCNADTAFIVPSRIAQLADSRGGPHDYRIWLEPDIEAAMDLVRDVERMINAGNEELDNRRRLAKLAVGHMLGFRTLVKNVAEALGSPQFARSK